MNRAEFVWSLAVWGISFLVRLIFNLFYVGSDYAPMGSDSLVYDLYGWSILTQGAYVADLYGFPNYVNRLPGFPLLLAGIYAVAGRDPLAVRIVLSGLMAGVVVILAWMTRQIGGRRAGWTAALIGAFYPYLVYYTGYYSAEVPFVFFFTAAVVALRRGLRSDPHLAWGIGGGVLIGLAILTRGEGILFVPLFAVWALWQFGRTRSVVRFVAVTLLAVSLTIAPWVVRNSVYFGKVVMISGIIGQTWLGATNSLVLEWARPWNPVAHEGFRQWYLAEGIPGFDRVFSAFVSGDLDEIEFDRACTRLAWDFIRSQPWRVPELLGWRLYYGWMAPSLPWPFTWHRLIQSLAFWVLFPFMMLGWRRLRLTGEWKLVAIIIIYVTLTFLLFYGTHKFRLAVEPFLVMLAALGVDRMVRRDRRLASRTVGSLPDVTDRN